MSTAMMELPSAAAMNGSSAAVVTTAHRLATAIGLYMRDLAAIDITQSRVVLRLKSQFCDCT